MQPHRRKCKNKLILKHCSTSTYKITFMPISRPNMSNKRLFFMLWCCLFRWQIFKRATTVSFNFQTCATFTLLFCTFSFSVKKHSYEFIFKNVCKKWPHIAAKQSLRSWKMHKREGILFLLSRVEIIKLLLCLFVCLVWTPSVKNEWVSRGMNLH